MIIARYTAKVSGIVPTFNSGYQYTVNETESNGIYTVELYSEDDFTSCSFRGKGNLLTVEYLKVTNKVTSMSDMFSSCYRLTQLDTSNWDTSQVTNMNNMFASCSDLTQLDVSKWNTSNVENIGYMFYYCESLTQLDVSKWNTNKITDMRDLFGGCSQLTTIGDVSNWDTSNVTTMDSMFYYCSQLAQLDVSNFDTSKVTNMGSMFYYCSQLTQLDVSNWDTSNVTVMSSMFQRCSELTQLDVSNFDTKNVTTMRSMFSNCSSLTQLDLSNFNTSNVTDMDYMFSNCSQLIQLDVSNFDTSKVTRTSDMFTSCSSLNNVIATNVSTSTLSTLIAKIPTRTSDSYGTIKAKNITNEITSSANAKYWNVTDKMLIARYTANVSGVVPTFNEGYQYTVNETVSDGIYTVELRSDTDFTSCSFEGKSNLLTVEYLKVTSSVTTMNKMFRYCSQLTQVDVSNFDTSNVTNMASMFNGCAQLTQLDVSNFNTSKVTTMTYMFCDCNKLTQLDVSNWVTSSVTGMNNMFQNCSSLTTIGDTSNWNISKVQYMNNMFDNCSSFTQLNVNNWNTSNVKETSYMFQKCSSLTQLDLSNWVTSNVTRMDYMFNGCSKLTQLGVSNWVTSKVTTMSYMFAYCSSLTQLDASNWDMSKVTGVTDMFYDCTSFNNVIATNVSTSTLSTLVNVLPTRTSNSYGTIKATETTDEITSSANAKYWNIDAPMLIARYTANASGVVPTFNEGYQYEVNETVNNGIYTVEIKSEDDFTSCSFNKKYKLLTVEYLKVTNKVTTMTSMFEFCQSLTQLDLSNWDTSKVTNMNNMFRTCSQLTQLDLSNFDTSSVTKMSSMFYNCSQLTSLDLSNFDTSKVTNMENMFVFCSKLAQLDISNFDTSKVTKMSGMFNDCSQLAQLDISNFDTSNVTNMSIMFANCSSLNNVIAVNVSTSTLSKLIDVLPTRTSYSYGTIKATDTTDEITSSANAKYWNIDAPMLIARYTANKSGVVPTFNDGYQYTINETESNGIYTVELISYDDFTSCRFSQKGNLLTVEYLKVTSNVTTMIGMFEYCYSLTSIKGTSDWDTSSVTDMGGVFDGCNKLTQLDVSKWNTNNVTAMNSMFQKCSSLTQLDASNWDTRNVKYMQNMFAYCSQLTQLDLSNFDTSNVKYMQNMFASCSQLTQLDLSNFDTSKVTNRSNMFADCTSLNNVIATNISTSTLSTLVAVLPTRTSDSYGTIKVNNTTDEITSSANAKYWNIDAPMLIARYTANASGIVPTFNDGYQYAVNEVESNGVYTVELYSDTDFTSCSFSGSTNLLTVEYLKVTSNVASMKDMFYKCSSLTQLDVSNWDTSNVKNMNYMFSNCSQLTTIGDISNWDTSNVTKMDSMFYNCSKLTQLDLSNWDTSSVEDMSSMFYNCSKLTQLDASKWVTSSVEDMGSMFYNCSKLTQLDLSKWVTSSVEDMYYMFYNCSQLTQLDLSNWDTKKVTSMGSMFAYCSKLTQLDVSNWDTSNVTSMKAMFHTCSQLTTIGDTSKWDTKNIETMVGMFNGCSQLAQLDLSNWDMSKVADMNSMFVGCSKLETILMHNSSYLSINKITNVLPTRTEESRGIFEIHNTDNISQINFNSDKYWDITTKYSIKYTFDNTLGVSFMPTFNTGFKDYFVIDNVENNITSRILKLNTQPTTIRFGSTSTASNREKSLLTVEHFSLDGLSDIRNMFRNCVSVTRIEVGNWDTSKIVDMSTAFQNCSSLTTLDVSNWDTSQVVNMYAVFQRCPHLTELNVDEWDTSSVINMSCLFYNCTSLIELNVDNWDTSQVTNMNSMFYNCSSLSQLNTSEFDMGNVTDVGYMFFGCSSLPQLDVSNWDIGQVSNMSDMFNGCSKITELDVSNWNTENVMDMYGVFQGCTELIRLDVSDWNTSQVANMSSMFSNCSKITELNVDNWKTENVEDMASIFYNCKEVAYLNLGGWDTRKVRDMDNMFGGCTVLSYLDLSNLKIDNVSNMNNMFEGCDALSFIGLVYSDISVLNKLPTFETMTLYVGGNINRSQYTGVSILKEYIEKEVKIISPIDLRSNGNVADRLYWNDEDKHYYIEQWIDSLTDEVLETPNIIATSITTPIEIKQFTNVFTIDVKNLTPSYLNITTPHFYIPDDYEYKEEEEVEYFKQSFELRFPDEDDVGSDWGFAHVEGDYSMGLKRVIDWVDNCDDETFVRDFDKYFHRQYTLRYFLLVITLGMVDNLGKNMMLDTFDHKIWMPRFYDMDTICSYDNSGQIKFDVDIEMAQGYWNTSASRLWTRIRDLMHNDLVATYKDMRANGMSYESFMKYFYDEQIAQIPQKYYNMDADVKYLPFADAYIGKAHGDGYEHLKRWLKRRLIFTDTLYDYQPSYINDILTIRANTTEKMTLEIETYTPVYQHLSWYNGQMDKQKIDGKTSVTFEGFAQASTDQEILIYGGSNIKSIKGISTCNPSQLLIGSATRLVELEARDCPMLSDINSMGANLLPHTYLNKLDLSGCTALSGNLNIQNSPLLIHLDVSRTGLTGINLPNAVKNMERMVFSECPNITAINMPNLYMPRLNGCKDMFKGCTNLKTVNLKGWVTPNITETNDMFSNCSSLTTLNLSNWDVSSITSANNMFNGCSSIIDVTPPKNLLISHDISSMISLSGNEVLEWVDTLSLIETNQIIILGSTLIVLLSEEDILRIINKGWSVG